ncbi:NADase-type glycan-binding domain-containing protein [Streptomyces sp. NPDC091272]|uniref:NADase-type glycan-binding domain-containing protein n=1 Tax=Streptomyces sp. NPDC091272 TaxID=3365981 RepID=UPI0038080D0D
MTTQNCADCGTRAEPDQSFCDACGAVLSWAGRAEPGASGRTDRSRTESARTDSARTDSARADSARADSARADRSRTDGARTDVVREGSRTDGTLTSPRSVRTAAPATAAPHDSRWEEERTAPTARTVTGTDAGVPGQHRPPATDPDPYAVSPEHGPASGAGAGAGGERPEDRRARSLLVPVADPEPRAAEFPSVAPVLPGRPDADRPQVRTPGHEEGAAGGLACPWCATPNRPDRHFCARCAMPMTRREEQFRGRLPWWRRLLGSRGGETPWAGDRPRLRRTFDSVLRWVGAAVVLALLIFLGMKAPAAVQATKDHFAKRAPVSPDEFTASRSFKGHQPALLFDKLSNTWWGPGVSQTGEGEWIEARFDEPTRLLDLILTPGVSKNANRLGESALPHRLKATVTTKDGRTTTRTLILDQGPGGQRRAFRVAEVTKVRFTVESAYGASASKQVALAEIEFFGPSRGENA